MMVRRGSDDLRRGIGERVRQARGKAGLSLRDLHALSELSPGFISDVERGKLAPGADVLKRLSEVLNVSIDWLVKGDGATKES